MTYDTLEYLMEIHYWALFELFVLTLHLDLSAQLSLRRTVILLA